MINVVEDMIRECQPHPQARSVFKLSMPNGAYKTEALERGYVDEANTNLDNPGLYQSVPYSTIPAYNMQEEQFIFYA